MKKIYAFILILLLIFSFSLTSCEIVLNTVEHHFAFEQPYENVVSIQIIDVKDSLTGAYEVIKDIDLSYVKDLYIDVQMMDMKRGFCEPYLPTGRAFLICYSEEYDVVISYPRFSRVGFRDDPLMLQLMSNYPQWVDDQEKIDKLIDKYMECEPSTVDTSNSNN